MQPSHVQSPQTQTSSVRPAPQMVSVQRALESDAEKWLRAIHALHVQRFEAEKKPVQNVCEEKLLVIAKKEAAALVNGGSSQNEFDDARARVRKEVAQQLKKLALIHDDALQTAVAAQNKKEIRGDDYGRHHRHAQQEHPHSTPLTTISTSIRTQNVQKKSYKARVESESDQDEYTDADGYKYKVMEESASENENEHPASTSIEPTSKPKDAAGRTSNAKQSSLLDERPSVQRTSTRHASGRSPYASSTKTSSEPTPDIPHQQASAAITIPKSGNGPRLSRPPVTRFDSTFSEDYQTDAGNEGDAERGVSYTRTREQRPYSLAFSGERFQVQPGTTASQSPGKIDLVPGRRKRGDEQTVREERTRVVDHQRLEDQKRRVEAARSKHLVEEHRRREEQLRDHAAARERHDKPEGGAAQQAQEGEREHQKQEADARVWRTHEMGQQKRAEEHAKGEQEAEFQRRADEAKRRYQERRRREESEKQQSTAARGTFSDGDVLSSRSVITKREQQHLPEGVIRPGSLFPSLSATPKSVRRPSLASQQHHSYQDQPTSRYNSAILHGTEDASGDDASSQHTAQTHTLGSTDYPHSYNGAEIIRHSSVSQAPSRVLSRTEAAQTRPEPPVNSVQPIPIPHNASETRREIVPPGSYSLSSSQKSSNDIPAYADLGNGYGSGYDRSSLGERSISSRASVRDGRHALPVTSPSPTSGYYAERWLPSTRTGSPPRRKYTSRPSVSSLSSSVPHAAPAMRASWPATQENFYTEQTTTLGSAAAIPRLFSSAAVRPNYSVVSGMYLSGRPGSPALFPVVES